MSFGVTSKFVPGNLGGLIVRLRGALKRGVSEVGTNVEMSAKIFCPVDTGTLRRSIQTEVVEDGPKISAFIGPQVDYGPYVEFGTGERGASSPEAGPGPYRSDWAGMTPQPYMRPALEEHSRTAPEVIADEIRQEF